MAVFAGVPRGSVMPRRWVPVAVLSGVGLGAVARRVIEPVHATPRFERRNAQDRTVRTASGLAPLLVAGVLVTAPRRGGLRAAGVAATGLGLAGLLDDLAGDRAGDRGTRGLAGHLGALRHGRVTTGLVKTAAGGLAGIGAAAALEGRGRRSRTWLLSDGAVVALAANLGNLLDRAPGRTTKVAAVVGTGLALAGRLDAGPALLLGSTLATLPDDLKEHSMLGDTGANLVGAALGVAVVAGCGRRGRAVALACLVGLTLASERWSFSAVIGRTRALRVVDEMGRRR